MLIPEVTVCIHVDSELHVTLFCKGAPFPFRNDFVKVKIVVFRGKECYKISVYTWNCILKTFILYLTNDRKICSQSNLFPQTKS